MKYKIEQKQIGFLIKDGQYIKTLEPGVYHYTAICGYQVIIEDKIGKVEQAAIPSEILMQDKEFAEKVVRIQVKDGFLGAIYKNESLIELVESGEAIYWNVFEKYECKLIDMRIAKLEEKMRKSLQLLLPLKYYKKIEIQPGEIGLLYFDNKLVEELSGGTYFYWIYSQDVMARVIDCKTKELDITGQEILTQDRIGIRLNLVCSYRICDPIKMVETIKGLENQIYSCIQLITREYVGRYRLDEILEQKSEISQYICKRMQEEQSRYCVEFLTAGIKDIILPGEIRDIMNTVLIAEKRAQANVITRREEVASTRSLLNTAKLMDENQTLYKLKEMEYLERICNQVGNINVAGGENLLVQLGRML